MLSSDGAWGLCYEHSPAEGVAVVQLMEQLLDQAKEPLSYASTPLSAPQPLQWQLTGPLHHNIHNAANNVNR